MIDILVAIAAVWAFILGLRRGMIVQLCHLVGLYVAILIAPTIASPIGSLLMDDPGKAYIAGFGIVVAVVLLVVWLVAPLLRSIVIWRPARQLDSLLGGVLNLATMVLVTAVLFSVFDRANISEKPRWERIGDLVAECESDEELREKILSLENGQGEMREYFYPRLVEYETLDASATFTPLAHLGDRLCPTLGKIDELIQQEAANAVLGGDVIVWGKEFSQQ
ncbi:MAG: CvpA family protein [Alistipes sp.]|nr:CvpA family protein [Alistipes sp.]